MGPGEAPPTGAVTSGDGSDCGVWNGVLGRQARATSSAEYDTDVNIPPSAACLGCVLIATSLMAQSESFVPANDISFAISTEQKSYGAREPISVKYRIVNVSNGPLYVPRGFEATVCLDGPYGGRPHFRGGFENSAGKHFWPGYGISCGGTTGAAPLTLSERMSRVAVLLHPGEHLDGAFDLSPTMFHLPPGAYRIEAVLYGWKDDEFSDAERIELPKIGFPLLSGEAPASTRIELLAADR
jgi:hypothetical protein